MALIGINQYQNDPQKDSTLDKIFKGVQIAQGVMGTALVIPKFLQDRKEFQSQLDFRKSQASDSAATRDAQVSKLNAETDQIKSDSMPLTPEQKKGFLNQGVPEVSLPRNQKEAAGLYAKLYETPAQKQSRQNMEYSQKRSDQMLGIAFENLSLAKQAGARADIKLQKELTDSKLDPVDKFPAEDKREIFGLVDSNVKKVVIGNQIDGYLKQWEQTKDPKRQLDIGRKLLKILNSTEGSDAVGTEESNRLGAKLKFAMGNFTNDNPVQFGRDMEGFFKDSQSTVNSLKGAVSANKDRINQIYEANGQPKKYDLSNSQDQKQQLKPGVIEDGHQYLGGNPADPNSWKKVQ